jgi:hypothetical protein
MNVPTPFAMRMKELVGQYTNNTESHKRNSEGLPAPLTGNHHTILSPSQLPVDSKQPLSTKREPSNKSSETPAKNTDPSSSNTGTGQSGSSSAQQHPHVGSSFPPSQVHGVAVNTVHSSSGLRSFRILLLVNSRSDHDLSQIALQQSSTTADFFLALRRDYFRLRGYLAHFFSIWRFHHCDFYLVSPLSYRKSQANKAKIEKWDRHAYAPRHPKNKLPPHNHHDYEISTSALQGIPPPVSEEEFYKRFYRRYTPGHTADLLDRLPKKLSMLDVNADNQEFCWGIYARERISFRWVFAYNILCILPGVTFFFVWTFIWKNKRDLQDASVPITMVFSLLSLFWSMFLSSLNYGSR